MPISSLESERLSLQQTPLSDEEATYFTTPTTEEEYPKEPLSFSSDETHILAMEEYPPSFTTKKEELVEANFLPGYGGTGYYSAPLSGRIRSFGVVPIASPNNSRGRDSREEKEKKCSAESNMTQMVGYWLASFNFFRQLVYIILFGLVLWIPGLVAVLGYGATSANSYNQPTVLSVGLFWWSIWLSSSWVGIWVCSWIANLTPFLIRRSLGVFAVALKGYIDYAEATRKYIAFLLWSLLVWIVYLSTVWSQFPGRNSIPQNAVDPLSSSNSTSSSSSSSPTVLSILATLPGIGAENGGFSLATLQSDQAWLIDFSRFFAGLVICSTILLAEKVAMQWIALSFHQTTYSGRIDTSNYHIHVLTALLSHIYQAPLQADTPVSTQEKKYGNMSSVFTRAQKFKVAILNRNERRTTLFHGANLVLPSAQFPFSPEAIVESALESGTQSRKLARQLFDSFAHSRDAKTGERTLTETNIASFFKTAEESHEAFKTFDRDNNGGCTWEEVQSSVLDIHQERICLLASLHDVDAAVLKLDNFFMSFYLFLSCVIIAALLSTKFSTLVASLGTILLGLSWLIGSTAQECLASIVWVFGKHPVDVGDTIEVPGLFLTPDSEDFFIVEEIQLLSTILKTNTGKQVIISNAQLAQKPIINVRRSGAMEEKFTINVEYSAPLDKVKLLREKMMEWIESQGRDFIPGLDVELDSLGDQSQLDLTFDIRYKSNWQDDHLKARRRNRWIVALKTFMAELQIYGPKGDTSKDGIVPPAQEPLSRIASITLMDSRDTWKDDRFSTGPSGQASFHESVLDPQQQTSRLHEVIPASSRRHSNPTTQVTSFNVRGRRGEDEQVGDLERGSGHF